MRGWSLRKAEDTDDLERTSEIASSLVTSSTFKANLCAKDSSTNDEGFNQRTESVVEGVVAVGGWGCGMA